MPTPPPIFAADLAPGPAEPPIVQVDRVSKHYPGVNALRGVSFNVQRGEIFGLLGPNGAGKSTLLKLMLGFLSANSGTIKLFGSADLTAAHARTGYLPEQPSYHSNFTGREYMEFQAHLAGLSASDARTVAARALKQVGIEEEANKRISAYSKGMRQRLGLAVALSAGGDTPPELLILDEPAAGLAPEGQVAVRETLLDCRRQGSTIILCSHQLTEVERICSEVGILRNGRLVALTRLQDESRVMIVATARPCALEVAPHLLEYLEQLHPSVAIKGGTSEDAPLYVSLPAGSNVPHAAAMKAAAIRALVDARWDISSLHIENRDLESIYLQAVGPIKDEAAADSPNGKSIEIPALPEVEQMPAEASHAPALSSPQADATSDTALPPNEPEPSGAGAVGDPLLVRPVSSNGSSGATGFDNSLVTEPGSARVPTDIYSGKLADAAPNTRNGPSTTPLPALLEVPDPRTELPPSEVRSPWFKNRATEGEGQ